jgi:predicted lipid-binding transport protein (Tim44 family)
MTARQRALVRAPRARPAEATGVGGGLVAVVAALVGAPVEVVAVIAGIAGFLPAAVTWLVSHGGIRGTLSALWRGTTPPKD